MSKAIVKNENSLTSERDKFINAIMNEINCSFELANSIFTFAEATVPITLTRCKDIRRDKIYACKSFFGLIKKIPETIQISDVNDWHQWMLDEGNQKNAEGLAESTIYTRLSHLSAYFEWLKKLPEFAHFIKANPVRLALPKPPKKYNSQKTKSRTDEELNQLWDYVENLAKDERNKTAIRDFAIFKIFISTGMRREEVIDLGAADIKFTEEGLLIQALFKGGDYEYRVITDQETIDAVKRYLRITKRENVIGKKNKALWIRMDQGAKFAEAVNRQNQEKENKKKGTPNKPIIELRMTSDSFDKNIKKYAKAAGIGHFHIHQFRHTFARIISEDLGLLETQESLGHANADTTRQYVQKIKFKRDKYSQNINNRRKPMS